jgi:hypothetical protein
MIRGIIGLALFCCSFQAFSTSHPKQLQRCVVSISDPSNTLVDKFSHSCVQLYGKQLPNGIIHLLSKKNGVAEVQARFDEPIGYCVGELEDKLFTCVTSSEYLITIEVKSGI